MAADKKIDHLADTWLFSTCSRRELSRIARTCDEIDIQAGRVLTTEGESGREFFVIRSGQATVRRNKRKIASIGPGQYFGELSLLSRLPRNSTITADTDMSLLVLGQRELSALIEDVPSIAHKMLEAMAKRLSESDSRMVS
ncbi:MAG TPA: cyclic nucleotide-binding domain-containing protein [Acidimicrobiales bacterium]|nr:cyclic nucleotide-binding domain-containing protein [Acidimicrobiales bacterium]